MKGFELNAFPRQLISKHLSPQLQVYNHYSGILSCLYTPKYKRKVYMIGTRSYQDFEKYLFRRFFLQISLFF
jgi:hypothetical protein